MYKLSGHSLTKGEWFNPESQPMQLGERDSTSTITLGPDAPDISFNDWLLDDRWPEGDYVWRVKSLGDDAVGETGSYELEHVIKALDDIKLFGEVTTAELARQSGATTVTAQKAVEYILSKSADWTLGDFDYNVSNPYEFNGDSLFDALETVTETLEDAVWEYDLSVYPFRLHIRHRQDGVACEMRAGRNLTTLKRNVSRSGMFTRIYPVGKNDLHLDSVYLSKNENLYGRIDQIETDQSKSTKENLRAWAQARLNRHCEPMMTISISGLELSADTGESLDRLKLNRVCRCPLPKKNVVISEKIVKLQWRDRLKEPENVTVNLCNSSMDVATIIRQQSRSSGKAKAGQAKQNYLFQANGENLLYEVFDDCGHVHGILRMTEESLRIAFDNTIESVHSEFLMTAESLRIQFENEIQSTRSEFQMTSESLRIQFENDIASTRSEFQMTSESLRIQFENEISSARSEFQMTAESLRVSFESGLSSARSEFQMTAESLRVSFESGISSARSEFQMTAESLRVSFENETSSLRSDISVQAGRIGLVVSGSGSSAAIRLDAIVDGINQSQLELSADRVIIGTGDNKKAVKVYVDGQITATEGQITNLKTGVTKATLINTDGLTGDYVSATVSLFGQSVSVGVGTQGGSGHFYYRGSEYTRKSVRMGPSGNPFIEGYFLSEESTNTDLNHYHKIVAEEGTGSDAGKIIITLSDPVATSDSSQHTTNFNIADTTAYKNGVLSARNNVKVNPFTADARQGALDDHRTFTYTTDAPTPSQATPQVDTWYLTGGTSWSNNKSSVSLRYGSTTGTAYATLEVDASDVATAANHAGRAAVTLNEPTADAKTTLDDNRTFTVSTSGRTNSSGVTDNLSKTVPLHLYASGWSSNKATVYLKWGATGGSSGTNYAQLEVDASSLVTSAGYAGRAAVTLSEPTADAKTTLDDNRTFTVSTSGRTNSSGTTDNLSKTVPLHLYAGSWSSNKKTVYLKWGASSGSSGTNYAQLEVDASSLVTNAGYAGRAAVTLNDPAWNAITGAVTDTRTATVSTSGRTNSSGTTDNLSKSIQCTLTASGLTVSLRHGGTSGTEVAKKTCSDANLAAGNIKSGVTIFGVTGSYAPSDTVTIYPTTNQSLDPGGSVTVYARKNGSNAANITVSAKSDSNLTAGNIKSGVTIFGVTGTYSGGSHSITITPDTVGKSSEPDGTRLWSTTTFIKNRWYKMTVKCGTASKVYKILINCS